MDPRAEALALMAPNGSVVCSLHRLHLALALAAPSTAMADMLLPCTRLRTPTRSATSLFSLEDVELLSDTPDAHHVVHRNLGLHCRANA